MLKVLCCTLLIEDSPQALPLGAACVASAVKNSALTKNDFSAELLAFSLESDEIKNAARQSDSNGVENADEAAGNFIGEKIAAQNAAAVLMSVYVWNRTALETAAKKIKEISPKTVIIAGGPEITANPLSSDEFDFTVAGAGEQSCVLLLNALKKSAYFDDSGRTLREIQKKIKIDGVFFPRVTEKSDSKNIVRSVPYPPESLSSPYLDGTLDASKYGGALWELARGCPFKCSYCYESKSEKHVAHFPVERLEKELKLFAKSGVAQVFVLDPTYNADKKRALSMLKLIEKNAPGIFFYFEARAEFIDRELAEAFARIPCALQIGLQSADETVLKNVNRTLNKKQFIKNTGFLNKSGVTFGFDLIYGLPGDTYKGFKNSIDFALKLYPNNLELFCLSVLPGTDLHDAAENFGLEWQRKPPYHVLKTPDFSEKDFQKAAELSHAVNVFYTQGRAVSWFNCVIYHLCTKPSTFFEEFAAYLRLKKTDFPSNAGTKGIRALQKEFIRQKFDEKHISNLYPVISDIIDLYGAMSDADGDGKTSVLELSYFPEDLLSEYAMNLPFFAENAKKHRAKIRVFPTPDGASWE